MTASTSSTIQNKKWVLVEHPDGHFDATRDAKLVEETIDLDSIDFDGTGRDFSLEPDQVVVQVEALSIDAFLRTMLDPTAYHGNIHPGSTLPAMGYGTVLKAGPQAKFKPGTTVSGLLGASTIAMKKSSDLSKIMSVPGVKTSLFLGYLGISGLTAYTGMFLAEPNYPQKGETVVVSAAAGATGSIAAQMAKLCGAKVVGIAGGKEKTKFLLEELGLDGAIDYKDKSKSVDEQLDEQCPDGIDFFFDNVGGEILDVILERITLHARIIICGAISQYGSGNINKKGGVRGPSNYTKLAERSSTMTGFNMMHHSSKFYKAFPYLLWHYYRGNIKVPEQIEDGIESFPFALEKLFSGGHCGRLLVNVDGKLE